MGECDFYSGIGELVMEEFPSRLKDVRITAGLTQQQLADEIGVSVAALSYYETGKRIPDIIFLAKLHEYFQVPIDYFLGYTESKCKEYVDISKELNLSDKAIKNIISYMDKLDYGYDGEIIVLNHLLENKDFYSVLNLLAWSGFERHSIMPDKNYVYYIATQRMMNVITDTIKNGNEILEKIINSILPEQKEQKEFFEWMLEQSQSGNYFDEIGKRYKKYRDSLEEKYKNMVEEFREDQQDSIRNKALNKLKEASENGKHQTPKE